MCTLLHIKKRLTEEKQTLEEMYKNHPCHAPRMRSHAILMSDAGFSLQELVVAFDICRQTASTWLHSWDELSICGLLDGQRSGRPNRLSVENQHQAIELVKEFPRSLKTVLARLCELTGINVSRSSLKERARNLAPSPYGRGEG